MDHLTAGLNRLGVQNCAACGKAGAKSRCAQCRTVSFCGKACQKVAWPSHKRECRRIVRERDEQKGEATAAVDARPGPDGSEPVWGVPGCLRVCCVCGKAEGDSTFKECEKCHSRIYCSRGCRRADRGHKKLCGASARPDSSHQSWCACANQDPVRSLRRGDPQHLVLTGQTKYLRGDDGRLISTGFNTCIFVLVRTTRGIVGWHASVDSDIGTVSQAFSHATESSMEGGRFVSGFIVPGVDRDENMDLKRECRSMRMFPFQDPTMSKRRVLTLLSQFSWHDRLERLPPPRSYKDFVIFDTRHARPYTFSDEPLFDANCVADGEKDSDMSRALHRGAFIG